MIWAELAVLFLAAGLVLVGVFAFGPKPAPLSAGKHRQERQDETKAEEAPAEDEDPNETTQRLRWYDEGDEERPLYPR